MLLHMEVTPDIYLDSMKYKGSCILGSAYIGPLVRVCTEKIIFLFPNQNICCWYSKEPFQ